MIIECKKSTTHAWVLFTRPYDIPYFDMSGQVYDFPRLFSTESYEKREEILGHPFLYTSYFSGIGGELDGIHYYDFDRIGISYEQYKLQEDSKKERSRNDILGAINQIVKSQVADIEESFRRYTETLEAGQYDSETAKRYPYFPIKISFLAIVFDGKLFEARVAEGKTKIKESDHILYHNIYCQRETFDELDFWIDIVKREYFPTYLRKIDRSISKIQNQIISGKEQLMAYLKTPF